jgi:hypothetical protein
MVFFTQIVAAQDMPESQADADSTEASDSPFDVGMDLVSRYLFRGIREDDTPQVQPHLYYTISSLQIGAWGSYSLSGEYSEIDLFAQYTLELGSAGSLSLAVYDYYFSYSDSASPDYFDYGGVENDLPGGSHTLEGILGYTGPESFPISAFFGYNFYNDPDNSAYVEARYPVYSGETTLNLFAGAALNASPAWYYTDDAAPINIGLAASRDIVVTDHFSVPVEAALVLNPDAKQGNLVFKMSF